MSPARAQTRSTQFRDEPSNHEAIVPQILNNRNYEIIEIIKENRHANLG